MATLHTRKRAVALSLRIEMTQIHGLQYINSVDTVSRVCIALNFNSGYCLEVEGSFSISQGKGQVLNSDDYIDSDFDIEFLDVPSRMITFLKGAII